MNLTTSFSKQERELKSELAYTLGNKQMNSVCLLFAVGIVRRAPWKRRIKVFHSNVLVAKRKCKSGRLVSGAGPKANAEPSAIVREKEREGHQRKQGYLRSLSIKGNLIAPKAICHAVCHSLSIAPHPACACAGRDHPINLSAFSLSRQRLYIF